GLALLELGRNEEALACYRKAAQAVPGDPLLVEKIAQICERLGRPGDAVQAALRAAELHLKNREVDKAIENWVQVTLLDPEHLAARSRLAVVYERMGRRAEAVEEYLWVASIVQRAGAEDKALQAVNYALQIMPGNVKARQYLILLRHGQPLPRPPRPEAGPGRPGIENRAGTPAESAASQPRAADPVNETRQKALVQLADYLFEQKEDKSRNEPVRKSAGAILRGGNEPTPEETEQADQVKILRSLGQAIEEQTQGMDALAMVDLANAVEAGLNLPAAYFMLGLLESRAAEDPETALPHLRLAVKHPDYALAAHLVAGQALREGQKTPQAAVEYLEALKLADGQTAPAEHSEDIQQLYDPIIANQLGQLDDQALRDLCGNISALLSRPDWKENLAQAREQLPAQPEGSPPILVEMLLQTRSTEVVESLARIRKLSEQNLLHTAMEEAFSALQLAPNYLPLHSQIGDILLKEDHTAEAVEKYAVVARAYSVRGESSQAVAVLRRLLQLDPSNLSLRQQLIEQLVSGGQTDEAVRAYMELADIYYRQMDFDRARATYATALRLVQSAPNHRDWMVEILNRMADIDLQRLDLRQALRLYEQVRSLRPDDARTRMNIIALNFRMGQETAARGELDKILTAMEKSGKSYAAAGFLNGLAEEHPELADFARAVLQQRA
ncbi:MAG TPA: tetratricopeptide repeat protein, partial [Anaerolineaceae bacterium]